MKVSNCISFALITNNAIGENWANFFFSEYGKARFFYECKKDINYIFLFTLVFLVVVNISTNQLPFFLFF